ncbi:MAG: hypothetical protein KF726_28750 [Anaerolineae bacterium]|nr:hypothetical protein [Anaerolineae bacterium]
MRILRWSLILLLTLIAVTGGTLLIGRAQPDQNPLRWLGFQICDDKPCFHGIVPSKTTWSAANSYALFSPVWTRPFNYQQTMTISQAGIYEARFEHDSQFVTEVIVRTDVFGFPTLGKFVDLYGDPCAVVISQEDSLTSTTIIWSEMQLGAVPASFNPNVQPFNRDRFIVSPDDHPWFIVFSEKRPDTCDVVPSFSDSAYLYHWQGFKNYEGTQADATG